MESLTIYIFGWVIGVISSMIAMFCYRLGRKKGYLGNRKGKDNDEKQTLHAP